LHYFYPKAIDLATKICYNVMVTCARESGSGIEAEESSGLLKSIGNCVPMTNEQMTNDQKAAQHFECYFESEGNNDIRKEIK